MKKTLLKSGWQVRSRSESFAESLAVSEEYRDVEVPHDAVISLERDPEGDPAVGYFPGGVWEYRRPLTRSAEDSVILMEFEGVYRDARVTLDGALVAQHPNGYTGFTADLGRFCPPGVEHELIVEARCGRDSRWYSGAGIYRPVRLLTAGEVYIAPTAVSVRTMDANPVSATIETRVDVASVASNIRTVELRVVVTDPNGFEVARSSTPITVLPGEPARSRSRFTINAPLLWHENTPALYRVTASVHDGSQQLDTETQPFGIRTIRVDAKNGLRINGEPVNLRGACIHHDNGLLGAATYGAAEERRVIGLKNAGFNAIRSAHHPMSVALLDACDRHGMYVLDETFDMWTTGKSPNDYSKDYLQWWESDVEAMISKDLNHPSVILYGIGNEIGETGSPWGGILGRRQAEKTRDLDESRPITNSINAMLSIMDEVRKMAAAMGIGAAGESADINTMMSIMGELVNMVGSSDTATERTAESFALLDVAGMNYLEARYETDPETFPHRVILGTETFPATIAKNWQLVTDLPHVIGDFTWTGWDYLGEVGIGRVQRITPGETAVLAAPYPWIAAWCGDIDLIGDRRPQSYYREIVFGRRRSPYVMVHAEADPNVTELATPWSWPDGLPSWTWPGHCAQQLRVEVYSDADQVELLLENERVAVVETGPNNAFRGTTTLVYREGTLTARAVRAGESGEVFTLRTASGAPELRAKLTSHFSAFDGNELAFVELSVTDSAGTLLHESASHVRARLDGPGELLALGSADPCPETFLSAGHTKFFRGRALAIVRLSMAGTSSLYVEADGSEPITIDLGVDSIEP
ncbi:glycoside hydrolase family 2 TIM barrel-domain containing protein [Leifsonia aquatica]|uniref:glycoside hydrolase family 2 TIM barrel-domain containing protein n=1 Tax=Leifsonia aquatica TaxID=144185 RepID=UPI000468A42D|nr:glycoside hydrolase family 2 TIM barrel-domain containing protein [Leifsonia aquatica]